MILTVSISLFISEAYNLKIISHDCILINISSMVELLHPCRFTHLLTHSLAYSLIHSLIHLLIHLIGWPMKKKLRSRVPNNVCAKMMHDEA